MASVITFDGARSYLGDEWADDSSGSSSALGDFAYTFLGWGLISFAVASGGIRLWRGLGIGDRVDFARERVANRRAGYKSVPNVKGARRRRR